MKVKSKNKKRNCLVDGGPFNIGAVGNTLLASGLFNQNFNPNQETDTLQDRIDNSGMGASGQNPLTRGIDDALGLSKKALINDINQYGNQAMSGNSIEDVLTNYQNNTPLRESTYDPSTNMGGEFADTLSAVGQGAAMGSSFGLMGAAIGGGVGLVSNVFSKLSAIDRRDDVNNAVRQANEQRFNRLNQLAEKVNKNNAYNMMSSYFANGGQIGEQQAPGLTFINNGGTHEQNPLGGVPQGVDPQGTPNLVEEGEVKTNNNYVFSNRNKPTTELLKEVGLPHNLKTLTFADIAKLISKESSERPNDPISKKGLETQLAKLKQAQEMYNQQEFENRMQNDPEFREQVLAQQQAQVQQQQIQQQAPQQQMMPQQQIPEQQTFANGGNLFLYGAQMDGRKKNGLYNDFNDPIILDPIPTNNTTPNAYNKYVNSFGQIIPNTNIGKDFNYYQEPVYNIDDTPQSTVLFNSDDKSIPESDKKSFGINPTDLRYAPAVANVGILGKLLADTPDYSNANALINMQAGKVSATPLRDYMTYKPSDTNYLLNQLHQQQAASRNSLANASGGNRATYLASALGSDYNYGINAGNVAKQTQEYNDAQKRMVFDFNRATNQYNAQSKLQADLANASAQAEMNRLNSQGYLTKQQIADSYNQDIASAISGVAENLGTIGTNEFNLNMANSMTKYAVNRDGVITYETPAETAAKEIAAIEAAKTNTGANGGQLKTTKIKINKGLTYEF